MKIFVIVLLLISNVLAHRLYILANDDGKTLQIKSYFTKSSPCKDCEVAILDADKNILAKAKTSSSGEANISMPQSAFDIQVTASMGHQNSISYQSEHQVSVDENISTQKILLSLGIIFVLFFILYIIKRKK